MHDQLKLYEATLFESMPTDIELAKIRPGDCVKVCADPGERFWVLVTAIEGNLITGHVDSLVISAPVECGEQITFGREYVIGIYKRL
jgi:hypothetical protein